MTASEEKNWPLRSQPLEGLESPFLGQEFFVEESETEWQPRLGALEAESPFQRAFEQPWAAPGAAEVETEASAGEWESADESESEDQFESEEEFESAEESASEQEFETANISELEDQGVIGSDNRVRIKNTTGVPWRWICKILVQDNRGRPVGNGTGVLISNKHVLTAAHVVYDAYKNMQQYTITVTPALDDLDEPFDRYALASKPKIRQEYDPASSDHLDWDYALLTLGTTVGEKKFKALKNDPLCYWASPTCGANTVFARLDPRTLNGKAAYTAGYPGGKGAGKQLWCAAGILHSANEKRRTMGTTADATKGQSGSPVWVVDNKKTCLVGVAVGAGTGSNIVVRVTRELVRQLRAWVAEDGETPAMVETKETLEPPVQLLPEPEAEEYEPSPTELSRESAGEEEDAEWDNTLEQAAAPQEQETETGEDASDSDGEFTEAWTVESTEYEMGEGAFDSVRFQHQTHGSGSVPPWAAGIDPFPITPTLAFHINEPGMTRAFAPVLVSPVRHLCAALVDLSGNSIGLPYAGLNDDEMVFAGSMVKICAMYAAFALRSRVQAFVDAAAANGASVVPPGITGEIEKAWKPKLQALFPARPAQSFGNKEDITFPRLDKIFTFSPDGKVDFASATPALTDTHLDGAGEFGVPKGRFHDWMHLMLRWSNNTAASYCILALGYFYINGALGQAGFFDSATSNGLWLSADYAKHDWVTTAAEKKANAAGQLLTPRWATAQRRHRSNVTATASQTARFMTLLALGKLVAADANHNDPGNEMRTLMQAAIKCVPHGECGVGSYVKDALGAAGRPFTALAAKKGYGDDSFSHECAIVERTVGGKDLRYVVVGLGSAPRWSRRDLSDLFVRLDRAIVARNS